MGRGFCPQSKKSVQGWQNYLQTKRNEQDWITVRVNPHEAKRSPQLVLEKMVVLSHPQAPLLRTLCDSQAGERMLSEPPDSCCQCWEAERRLSAFWAKSRSSGAEQDHRREKRIPAVCRSSAQICLRTITVRPCEEFQFSTW